jgi:exonuclease III
VGAPPPGCALEVLPATGARWRTAGWEKREWRTAVARLSNRVSLTTVPTLAVDESTGQAQWTVSRNGTIAAADVIVQSSVAFTAVSVYAPWEYAFQGKDIWADGSAHRILSDLSVLLWADRPCVLVAGDWNILRGYGEHRSPTMAKRYQTVFDRAQALGLQFVGPEAPDGGRQAEPWPAELPQGSKCVPTFHHSQQTPASATRQLDFVFATGQLAERVRAVRALNDPDEWGPSDHCRVVIEVDVP